MADQPERPDLGKGSSDEDAWASIVANFGERAELSEDEIAPEPRQPAEPIASDPLDVEEHYIPPAVPQVGLAEGPRGAAWLGLLGAPALFVIALLTGIAIPGWLAVVAVIACLVSLGYLVATMRRDDDDHWNDGAVV